MERRKQSEPQTSKDDLSKYPRRTVQINGHTVNWIFRGTTDIQDCLDSVIKWHIENDTINIGGL